MKKLLTLLLSALVLLSACPLVAFAAADITAEMLAGGQPPQFITEDLSLPANDDITWTSDKPEIISAAGKVTRPLLNDEVVTLTATDAAGSKSVSFTVKSLLVSGIAINDSFNAPFYDETLQNQAHPAFTPLYSDTAAAVYQNENADYYLDYSTTGTYDRSRVSFSQTTGTVFPAGSAGKYIFEFDAHFDNTAQTLFTFTGNGTAAVRFNNSKGNLKISNTSDEWYGSNNTTYTTIESGTPYTFKLVIHLAETPLFSLYCNNAPLVTNQELIAGSAFDQSIGLHIKTRDNTAAFGVKIDNFRLYTESSANEVLQTLSNADRAHYFAGLLTESTITEEKHYAVEGPLSLSAPLVGFDLEALGVVVSWSSSDSSVITSTGAVSQKDGNRYVVLTASVTAGTGEEAVTVTKEIPFTVAAADSGVFTNASMTYSFDFESDAAGAQPAHWTASTGSAAATAAAPGRSGNALEATLAAGGTVLTASATSGTLTNSYFISADVNFTPADNSKRIWFLLKGADTVAQIGFDYAKSAVVIPEDGIYKSYMVPGVAITPGSWYHIDLAYNAAKKTYIASVNGKKVIDSPVDIPNNVWSAWYNIRQTGISSEGAATGYIDNLTIRQSNAAAPVYDDSSDYTVRSISLTNQNGATITDIASTTTKVRANVKLLQNRPAQDGEAKIILARYNTLGQLADLVMTPVTTSNNGLSARLEMTLSGDCTGHSLKAFVLDSDSLRPAAKNLSTAASKFDTARLFSKPANAQAALELGYAAESDYEGIDAIMYDGDTYKGRPVKHFAYIGLPEGASAESPVPAVVCVHGGGGTAYDEWVKKWNDAGYAAIAMNLNGRIPSDAISDGNSQLRHAWAGATQDNYAVVSPDDAAWMYSAVTAIIGAHNVLRAMPEVDNSKIGITGVSWGGVATSTAMGVDNRFAFAIPSYGCGFLYGSETYMADRMTEEKISWEPSSFFQNASLPVLWMNGDSDGNFSLTSTTKSAELMGEYSYVSIIPGFGHSHPATWNRPEPYAFADSIVKGGAKLIRGSVTVSGSTAAVSTSRSAVSATMYYSTDEALSYENGTTPQFSYRSLSSSATNTDTFSFTIPSEAKRFYVVFTDENGYSTSTTLVELN